MWTDVSSSLSALRATVIAAAHVTRVISAQLPVIIIGLRAAAAAIGVVAVLRSLRRSRCDNPINDAPRR